MINDKILKSINNLPAFPATVHRVSEVISGKYPQNVQLAIFRYSVRDKFPA
jgi:HD-like signal output (HDOD) protein